jgi:hypothetical protein
LAYLHFYSQKSNLGSNEVLISSVDRDNLEYRKKQIPTYAKDLNDYFYKNETSIRFLKDIYDFDTIHEGKTIVRDMYFVNEGKNPFFITDIKVSCGCTVPSYSKQPVNAGDTSKVSIEFKSKGKEGFVMNKLAIYGNLPNDETDAYFKIYVVK